MDAQEVPREPTGSDGDVDGLRRARSPEADQCMGDDRDDHRQYPVPEINSCWVSAVALVQPSEHAHDDDRRADEADTGSDQPPCSGALGAEIDGELGRVRTGDEVCRAEKIEELFIVEPSASTNHFVADHRDVRCRAAEAEHTEAKKQPDHLTQSTGLTGALYAFRVALAVGHFPDSIGNRYRNLIM